VVLFMGAALVVAGCSSSGLPAADGGAVSGGGKCGDGAAADFCGHIKVSGGYTMESDFHASSAFAASCSDWLKGKRSDPTQLLLPSDLTAQLRTDAVVQHYKGAGTYGIDDLVGDLGGFQVAVNTDTFIPTSVAPATVASATVNGDCSGTLSAQGLVAHGDSNKVMLPIDVLVTWTSVMKP
jgi:hypothetical protein